jgi:hypothetical protein
MPRIVLRGRLLSLGADSVRTDGAHQPDDFDQRVFSDWLGALGGLRRDGACCYLPYRFDDDYNRSEPTICVNSSSPSEQQRVTEPPNPA